MEKSKNRTDLLAAGRKKLQQFRQKKDHKASNSSSSSSHGKSFQKAGKRNEGEDAEVVQHDISFDMESSKVSQAVNAVEADASTGDLPVAKLLITLAEGGSNVAVREEKAPDDSLASSFPGEANGEMQELEDSGDSPDLLSERGTGPCQTSDQDADRLRVDQCNGSVDSGSENSEFGTSENGGEEASFSIPLGVKEDGPGPAGSRPKVTEEECALPLTVEETDKADGDISTSERADRTDEDNVAITHQGIDKEQGVIQVLTVENQMVEQLFASKNDMVDAEKTNEDADMCVNLGFDEAQVVGAVQFPAGTIHKADLAAVNREGTSSDECSDSRPAAPHVLGGEKEDAIVPAHMEGVGKFGGEGNEEKDPCRPSTVLESESMREDVMENSVSTEDVEVLVPGEETSSIETTSYIPTTFAWKKEEGVEILKRHLYLASVAKDFLQLQVTEQIDRQEEIDLKFSGEVSRLQDLIQETEEKCLFIHEELDQCRTELLVMVSKNNDLEVQCHSAKGKIEGLSARALELQSELELSQKEFEKLSAELADYKSIVGTLQIENSKLTMDIHSGTEEIQNLKAEKEESMVQIEDLSARINELQSKLELSQKESVKLSAELADYKSVVGTLQDENSKFTMDILSGSEEIQNLKAEKEQSTVQIEELSARINELQNELKLSKKESVDLSVELADCKGLLMALQTENSNLTVQTLSGTEDISKLVAEKDFLVNENMMLVSAVSEQKDQLAVALDKVAELEGDFKETIEFVEKFIEENIYLLSYLDAHKSKVKELENGFQELLAQAQVYASCAKNSIIGSLVSHNAIADSQTSHHTCAGELVVDKGDNAIDPCPGQTPSGPVEENDPNEPAVLCILKGHLFQAEEVLQILEKVILGMHAHPMSLGKSGSRMANSGVSKLIQAFESKANLDNIVSDDVSSVEGEKSADSDSCNFMMGQICNLRAILKQMASDAEMTKVLYKKEHNNMHIAKKFEVECETLTLQNNKLQKTIDALGMKLTEYKLGMDNLQSQFDNTWHNADEMVGRLLTQVESLQKEVNAMANVLGKEMNIMKDVILGSSLKLDAHTGLLVTGNLDIDSHLTSSVNAVTKMVEDLQEKLEAACLDCDRRHDSYDKLYRNYACLCESQESANRILHRIHNSFAELITDSSGHLGKPLLDSCENSMDVNGEGQQQLPPGDFEILIEQLSKLLNERSVLHSAKDELESELALRNCDMEGLKARCDILAKNLEESNSTIDELRSLLMKRDQDFDELNKACFALAQEVGNWELNKSQVVVPELVGNIEVMVKSDKMELDSIKQLLMHFGTLVTSLLRTYREATEQLNSSKTCLQEAIFPTEYLGHGYSEPLDLFIKQDIIPRIMELLKLEDKVNWLGSKNIQQENEMQILKESLSKVEEALENARSELNSKVIELEQSEQRLSSIREKLSIAVAKGKGLVVQRDSLKQSLVEKSSELERCLQELQSKEVKLFDLEAKLKSSEADRVEALESELSYIRNSATAFRDSFLQKDSVLQKIEEVMEELDLPEVFHSKDTVEKVEWLAKSIAESTRFQSADWEQKGSLGGSQADPGLVAMDAWKDDLQSVSSPGLDDLKRKYEELLSRFYGLAEQNEMLEQSLMERNDLVQRCERVLDTIDMPLQLKSSEPEDRLEWLGKKLLEVQQDRDSLMTKIDNLEISTESLLSELEASQEKVSDRDAALVTIRRENEFLSENLSKLRSDHFEVSDRAAQNELEKGSLKGEIASLQEKLAEKSECRDSLMTKIRNLESSTESLLSELETSQEKISNLDAAFVTIRRENEFLSEKLAKLRSDHFEVSDRAAQSELEKDSLKRKIADLQEKLAERSECRACSEIVTEIKKLHDLLGEALPDHDKPDTSSSDNSVKCLESSLRKLIDKYKTFFLEKYSTPDNSPGVPNNIILEEQNLKELLVDKEQNLMALKVELDEVSHNLYVVKEDRDTIIESCKVHIAEMEALMLQRDALQKERETAIDKCESLVSELEAMIKQRSLLQDQLRQEEQRSASMREKLNIAVRKGKGLVQQRDNLKQTIEEMNTEFDRLKKELNHSVESLQSENNLLKSTLAESENNLHDRSQTLNSLLTALYSIDLGAEFNISDPIKKMECIIRLSRDLRAAVLSSENDAIKCKKAAELLVAELNEVQERADSLQEDLGRAEAALAQCSRGRDIAEAEKRSAVSHLEQFMISQTEEKRKLLGSIIGLKDGIYELRKGSLGLSNMLNGVLSRDVDIFCSMNSSMESIMKLVDGAISVDLPLLAPSDLLSRDMLSEDTSFAAGGFAQVDISEDVDDGLIIECIQVAVHSLSECMREFADVKEKLHEHSFAVDQQVKDLCRMVEDTRSVIASRELSSESLKRDIAHFDMIMKNKENELSSIHRNTSLLYEACRRSILELENRRALAVGKSGALWTLPSWVHGEGPVDGQTSFNEDFIRTVADSLLTTVKGSSDILEEVVEERQKELKATILDLQRELQEKDVQQNRICAELVSQIGDAEAIAKKFSVDLNSAKIQVKKLESQIEEMESHQKLSELRINELENLEASAKEYEQRIMSLTNSLTAKDQEIEGLIQALDEEESQMENLQSQNQELEQIVQQNNLALENLEGSRAKALTKLSTTLSRFDELHHLSENLLAEIENLQSQIQERDSEISFLRQEVARCTNDVLIKQESKKRALTDLHEVQTWMDAMVLRLGGHKLHIDDQNPIHSYMKYLDKQIPSVIAELEDLRIAAQNKDALLDIEKGRVNELSHRAEVLEISLREKESQIEPSGVVRDPGLPSTVNPPDTLEVGPMVNKRSTLGSIVPHARSGRRVNSDQIAVAIDLEQDNSVLDDEDDDKAHGFKSLTTSKIVPRATRPIADRIDGLWVAIERLLMRQPTLRLGLIMYWVVLHALLAASI